MGGKTPTRRGQFWGDRPSPTGLAYPAGRYRGSSHHTTNGYQWQHHHLRRGRDLNPRTGFSPVNSLAVSPIRPLSHLSLRFSTSVAEQLDRWLTRCRLSHLGALASLRATEQGRQEPTRSDYTVKEHVADRAHMKPTLRSVRQAHPGSLTPSGRQGPRLARTCGQLIRASFPTRASIERARPTARPGLDKRPSPAPRRNDRAATSPPGWK